MRKRYFMDCAGDENEAKNTVGYDRMDDIGIKTKPYEKESRDRLLWVDVCRGIGILFVVLGHCDPPFIMYIDAFHMPLFFMLSGFLWKRNPSFKDTLARYTQRCIVPYFLLCFINLILNTVVSVCGVRESRNILHYIGGIIYSYGSAKWMPNCSPLWFLTALFVALLLYWVLDGIESPTVKWGGGNRLLCDQWDLKLDGGA